MKTALNYDKFEKYMVQESSHPHYGGYCYRFEFDNNYGASVVKHCGSYGYIDDLFELAILHNGQITYELYDDVLGHLTNDEVLEYLSQIKNI